FFIFYTPAPSSSPLLFFFLIIRPPPISTLFPYTTLFRSVLLLVDDHLARAVRQRNRLVGLSGNDDRLAVDHEFGDLRAAARRRRSEEHTSELQSRGHLVCRLLLEKKKYI